MKGTMLRVKNTIFNFIYFLTNNIVNKIPIWFLRKLIYRIFGMKIGNGSIIYMNVFVLQPWCIKIGERTIISEFSFLDGRGSLIIGNDVSISFGSKIFTSGHDINNNEFKYQKKSVLINDNVWLASYSIVLGGSIINDFTVISSGSVFKGVSETSGIYVGNPALLNSYRKCNVKYKQKGYSIFR